MPKIRVDLSKSDLDFVREDDDSVIIKVGDLEVSIGALEAVWLTHRLANTVKKYNSMSDAAKDVIRGIIVDLQAVGVLRGTSNLVYSTLGGLVKFWCPFSELASVRDRLSSVNVVEVMCSPSYIDNYTSEERAEMVVARPTNA